MRLFSGGPGRVRGRATRGPSRLGWAATWLVGPHVALGTWLVVVPDHLAFTAAQVVTLIHVGLALVTFPIAAIFIVVHARKMRSSKAQSAAFRPGNWLLTLAVTIACVTGLWVTWGGNIASAAPVHAAAGALVALPLAVHLWLASRRVAAIAALSTLALATGGGFAAKRLFPPKSEMAEIPEFAYANHDADLYEPAESCGECHVDDYADWKRSLHARTLELAEVQLSLAKSPRLLGENLAHFGAVLADDRGELTPELVFGACGSCHAPTAFYGNQKASLTKPTGLAAEGTGCSFCHTIREVRHAGKAPLPKLENGTLSRADIASLTGHAPFYVSAPETVRRYLFQGQKDGIKKRIANFLIRWRPQVHAWDYHSPVLDEGRGCMPCHSLGIDSTDVPHLTYASWEDGPFNTGDPKTTTTCQDCHMVREMTGKPVDERAKEVPWGPERSHARSHLFIGGNVLAYESLKDGELAAYEHAFNLKALSLRVLGTERAGDELRVTVSVRSEMIGHFFPALETQNRYGWVEVIARDASGKVIAKTPQARDSQDYGSASPLIMASIDDPKPDNRRLIAPGTAREYVARLALPAGTSFDHLDAELHVSVDHKPIATATWREP